MSAGPPTLATLLNAANRALDAADYRAAHGHCLAALKAFGPQAEAFFLLGILTAEHGNHTKALDLFQRALDLAPEEARLHAHRGKALLALQRREEARTAALRAAELGPRDALTWDTVGVIFTHLGDHDAAICLFEAAVARNPARAGYQYNLGASREFAGDFAGAETAFLAALELEPGLHKAWSSLVQLRKQDPADGRIEPLKEQFAAAEAAGDAERCRHLGHALAKSLEDMDQPVEALAWLKRAKAGERPAREDPVNSALFAAARATAPAADRPGWESGRPIFVTGLPRTGTTLVDRILSSHSAVVSAGELTNFALIVKRMAATPGQLVMDTATLEAARDLDFAALGQAYEQSTAALTGEAAHFVDKMPLNILYAGLIHAALPQARIIALRRHPMDACLSNYRQLFASGFSYYAYADDLEACGRYYLEFDRLCRHWRQTLPADRYLELAYEDIVGDLEGSVRRLLAHCGLDWDPACLDFHRQAAPVATASAVQVRQPLYSSSVGRWKRYGEALAPLRAILTDGGVLDGDGNWIREAEMPAGQAGPAV